MFPDDEKAERIKRRMLNIIGYEGLDPTQAFAVLVSLVAMQGAHADVDESVVSNVLALLPGAVEQLRAGGIADEEAEEAPEGAAEAAEES